MATPRAKLVRCHDADGGVGTNPPAMADQMNQKTGEQRPQPGANKKIHVHHIAENRAAKNGGRETAPGCRANATYPAQHDVDTDKTAEPADDRRCDEAITKEFVVKRD